MSSPAQQFFVKAIAWSLIVLGGLATIMAVLQIFLAVFLEQSGIIDFILEQPTPVYLPAWLPWVMQHLPGLSVAMLGLSILTVIIGWGLLKWREWARILAIFMMWLGFITHVAGLWAQARMLSQLRQYAPHLDETLALIIQTYYWTLQISGALFGVIFAIGFAWTGWKFSTPAIRSQFNRRHT